MMTDEPTKSKAKNTNTQELMEHSCTQKKGRKTDKCEK